MAGLLPGGGALRRNGFLATSSALSRGSENGQPGFGVFFQGSGWHTPPS